MNEITEELNYFTQQPEVKLIERAFGSIGRDYMDKINALGVDEPYVVDKLPHNFMRLGFIRAAFPDARIIHTNRDPMAVCWSNYQRLFPAKGMNFGNNLEALGRYYKLYLGIIYIMTNINTRASSVRLLYGRTQLPMSHLKPLKILDVKPFRTGNPIIYYDKYNSLRLVAQLPDFRQIPCRHRPDKRSPAIRQPRFGNPCQCADLSKLPVGV